MGLGLFCHVYRSLLPCGQGSFAIYVGLVCHVLGLLCHTTRPLLTLGRTLERCRAVAGGAQVGAQPQHHMLSSLATTNLAGIPHPVCSAICTCVSLCFSLCVCVFVLMYIHDACSDACLRVSPPARRAVTSVDMVTSACMETWPCLPPPRRTRVLKGTLAYSWARACTATCASDLSTTQLCRPLCSSTFKRRRRRRRQDSLTEDRHTWTWGRRRRRRRRQDSLAEDRHTWTWGRGARAQTPLHTPLHKPSLKHVHRLLPKHIHRLLPKVVQQCCPPSLRACK